MNIYSMNISKLNDRLLWVAFELTQNKRNQFVLAGSKHRYTTDSAQEVAEALQGDPQIAAILAAEEKFFSFHEQKLDLRANSTLETKYEQVWTAS